MIDLKTILGAVARTFGISSLEDLRKQNHYPFTSKSTLPKVDPNNQQSQVGTSHRTIDPAESATS